MADKTVPIFIPRAITPTSEQRSIQTSSARRTVVMANAGAAKTTTLALRAAESITRGVPAESVLALTFSEEAAEVLRRRLVEIGLPAVKARAVRIETFDAFAAAVLAESFDEVPVASLRTIEEVALKLQLARDRLRSRHEVRRQSFQEDDWQWVPENNAACSDALKVFRRMKGRQVEPARLEDETLDEASERVGVSASIFELYCIFESLRCDPFEGCRWRAEFDATFDLARLLTQDASLLEKLPAFRVVLVDELQDMNPAAATCLEFILQRRSAFFTGAGDFDQVIHHWSGADADFIRGHFLAPPASVLPLTQTFRHGPVMAYATSAQKNKPVTSGRLVASDIRQFHYPAGDEAACAAATLAALRAWADEGEGGKYPLKGCAVLLRSPSQSIFLENALLAEGIGWQIQGFQSYLTRSEVMLLRGLMAYALDDYASIPSGTQRLEVLKALVFWQELDWGAERIQGLNAAVEQPALFRRFFAEGILQPQTVADRKARFLSEDDEAEAAGNRLEKMAALRRAGAHTAANELLRQAQLEQTTVEDSPERKLARERLQKAVDILVDAGPDAPAAEMLERAVVALDIRRTAKRRFIDPASAQDAIQSLDGFIASARMSRQTLRAFSVGLQTAEARALKLRTQHTLLLSTVDAAKGHEYTAVIMPMLEQGVFPRKGMKLPDESNRWYVGITRMRDALYLVVPQEPEQRSLFVDQMDLVRARRMGEQALEDQANLSSLCQ